ncbi:hypothetical protein [Shimia ponticola]|uniref:hypothetical protein n=1 Tax=Shimia ponticola TaxID=2582893 RepID=UPI0011BF2125|nr:hypothetical protein [Shimia ponticola]
MLGTLGRTLLIVSLICIALILISPTRTVQLEARTLSAEATLLGEPFGWDLSEGAICIPSLDLDSPVTSPCKDGESFAGLLDGPVRWAQGQQLSVFWSEDDLAIILRSESRDWPAGTVLRIPHAAALRNGALSFTGELSIGQELSPGATGYVLDGTYAFFERGLMTRFFDGTPDIIRKGDLRRGDRARIVCIENWWSKCSHSDRSDEKATTPNLAFASFMPDHAGKAGFHIVALGEETHSALELTYAGRDTSLVIKPNWVQRTAASSGLLALSLLLSVTIPFLAALFPRKHNDPQRSTD